MRTDHFRKLWQEEYPGGEVIRHKDGLDLTFKPNGKVYCYLGTNIEIAENLAVINKVNIPSRAFYIASQLRLGLMEYAVEQASLADTLREGIRMSDPDKMIVEEDFPDDQYGRKMTKYTLIDRVDDT